MEKVVALYFLSSIPKESWMKGEDEISCSYNGTDVLSLMRILENAYILYGTLCNEPFKPVVIDNPFFFRKYRQTAVKLYDKAHKLFQGD